MHDKKDLIERLSNAINASSAERFCGDTPDFIVADLIFDVLAAFGKAIHARHVFYHGEPLENAERAPIEAGSNR